MEILSLADSLEILDLSNNCLSSLPDELTQLVNLKIVFFTNNHFDTVPEVLGRCPNLEMVSFKSNKIRQLPAASLPKKLRWLVLTDNQLSTLPDELCDRPQLQKLALAGNQLTHLPQNISRLKNLELVRISANQLHQCPDALLALPRLAWLAFAGNPFCLSSDDSEQSVPELPSSSFRLQETLGQGASGVISKARWQQNPHGFPEQIAVKVFKGEITSDGYPKDELQACLRVGEHANLVKSLAQVKEDNFLALIMSLIPERYKNLGLPPDFQTCTRDTFPLGFSLPIHKITKIIAQMEDVAAHLQARHVAHGDLYAHNTLIDDDANIISGDFGAASLYHMLNAEQQAQIELIEQRALIYFIEDLLSICAEEDRSSESYVQLKQRVAQALGNADVINTPSRKSA